MKKAYLLVALLLALVACDDIQIKSYEVKESHELVGWTQTDLGGGIYSAVSADWSVTNTGDMSFWSQLTVRVDTSTATYAAGAGSEKIQPGDTLTGTLIVDTAGQQATSVILAKIMPDVTEPW